MGNPRLFEEAPEGATHWNPHSNAFLRRRNGQWDVWSRNALRWLMVPPPRTANTDHLVDISSAAARREAEIDEMVRRFALTGFADVDWRALFAQMHDAGYVWAGRQP